MFMRKGLDTITLFHKATSPGSIRVLAALKDASAKASGATGVRSAFQLDVTEEAPTIDQLRCIIDYMKKTTPVSSIISGASNSEEAFKVFKQAPASFQRPLVVDWDNGRALATDKESEIIKMLGEGKGA